MNETQRTHDNSTHTTTTNTTQQNTHDNENNETMENNTTAHTERPELTTTWGPKPTTPRPANTIRIIFQNVNGIPMDDTLCIDLFSLAEALEPSLLGLAETKLDCKKYERTIAPLRSRLNRIWKSNKMTITDSTDQISNTSTYKPGGVMQIATGPICARIQTPENDKRCGRWTAQTLLHPDGMKSIYYTVYRVCKTTLQAAGETTAWKQQWRIQRNQGVVNPNPRTLFLSELKTEVQNKRTQNYEVFIMGDFNTPIWDTELQEFLHDCELFDLHEPCATHWTTPPTFKNGSTKIDHMFGTYRFLEATVSASILSWEASLPGDHRCLVIDLCQRKLNATCDDLTTPSHQRLISNSPRKAKKYRDKAMELTEKSKIQQRLDTLNAKCKRQGKALPPDDRQLAKIDNEMTGYM